jgi:hypothetical protein
MATQSAEARESTVGLLTLTGLFTLAVGLGASLRPSRGRARFDRSGLASLALFALAAVSGWRVFRQPPSAQRTRALALWGTQLALKVNWTRLFFSRHKAGAALADLVALWATLGAYMLQTRAVDGTAARLMAPYLGWVTYAGYLNEELLRKKRKFLLN